MGELEARLNAAIHEFTEGNISATTLARIEAELAPEISQARYNVDREGTGSAIGDPSVVDRPSASAPPVAVPEEAAVAPQAGDSAFPEAAARGLRAETPTQDAVADVEHASASASSHKSLLDRISTRALLLMLVVSIAAVVVSAMALVGADDSDGDDDVLDPSEWRDNPVPDPSEWRDNPVPEESDLFVVSTYCQQGAPMSRSGVNFDLGDALSSPPQYGPGSVVLVWSDGSQTSGGGSC